jgi:type IV pilus assembly protein PilC
MPDFSYRAYDESGWKTGLMAAESRREAAHRLRREGLQPVTIKRERFVRRKRLGRRLMAACFREWSSLLTAGLSMTESLDVMASHGSQTAIRAIRRMKQHMESGMSVSEAVKETGAFPPLVPAMISVGEASGSLPSIFESLSNYYEREDKLRKQMSSSLSYPVLVISFSFIVFIFLITGILPALSSIFTEMGAELPPLSAALLGMGSFLQAWGGALLLLLSAGSAFLFLYARSEKGKQAAHRLYCRIPLCRLLYLERLSGALSRLLSAGLSLSDALRKAAPVMGNVWAEREIRRLVTRVEEGESFDTCMKQSFLHHPLLVSLIHAGMKSGELPRFLEWGSRLLAEDMRQDMEWIKQMAGPVMILVSGVVTGLLAASLVMPLLSLGNQLV